MVNKKVKNIGLGLINRGLEQTKNVNSLFGIGQQTEDTRKVPEVQAAEPKREPTAKIPPTQTIGEREKRKFDLIQQGLSEKQAGRKNAEEQQGNRDLIAQQQAVALFQEQADEAISSFGKKQVNPSITLGDTGGDFAANVATNAQSIATGAAAGAGLGAVASGPFAPVGAVAGGIVGGISALLGKIALDKRQTTKEAKGAFVTATATTNKLLLNMANLALEPPADIVYGYELNLANIREAERELLKQTNNKIGKQLSGAQEELNLVQTYLRNEPFYRAQLFDAIRNPDPSKIYNVGDTSQDLNTGEDTTQQ